MTRHLKSGDRWKKKDEEYDFITEYIQYEATLKKNQRVAYRSTNRSSCNEIAFDNRSI